jgi:hypothetical protein
MLKLSHFLGESEHGLGAVPLFGPADGAFEKVAAPNLLPEVLQYIEALSPSPRSQYVLVNAMGAGEFYGSNINGDHFPEAALIHKPDDWTANPLIDKVKSRTWPYGFPTFYNAHPFAHHRNKNPARAFGEVELATWNPKMRRVELVVRVDKDKCELFGGVPIWDRLKSGQYPDVSMGTKVPFDTCSICLDWELYRKALQQFDPKKHRHAGMAVLDFHKKLKAKDGVGIRGLSITRKDYCEHARTQMNKILFDGRKVFVYNDFPRMFDISFVFIGADKTAKVMLYIFRGGHLYGKPSAEVAEDAGYEPAGAEKTAVKLAGVEDEVLKMAFLGKSAKNKKSEISKRVVPSQFAGKAVPILTKREPNLPGPLMDLLSSVPMHKSLSTMAGLGMIMRPREFQRIALTQVGKKPLADKLDRAGAVFPATEDQDPMDLSSSLFAPSLARLLLPLMAMRSALGPFIERRIIIICNLPEKEVKSASSHPSDLLRKIGSAYNGYRSGVMDLVSQSHQLIKSAASSDVELHKLASTPVEDMFTPLTAAYLTGAFLDERSVGDSHAGVVKVSEIRRGRRRVEGLPLSEHVERIANHV